MQCACARVEASITFKGLRVFSFFFLTMYHICRSISRTLRPGLTCAFSRVLLILRIFHKPNKWVGVVKCTDRVVVKWESDDQANELQVVQVAEASNNARKELGIQEKLVWDWRKKKTNYQE